jgi:hypothetical protein
LSCKGDCEEKGGEADDRKAQNMKRSIIATQAFGTSRVAQEKESTRRWFRRASRTKIPTDAAPAFIIVTEYLSIGWHETVSVLPNMEAFAITMAGHAEP